MRALGFLLASVLAVSAVSPGSSAQAALDPDLLAGLAARSIGPASVSGRIAAIDALAADANHIVIGAATGGVWISKNGGLTWSPVFDREAVASIGAVALDQSNPDVIWVGTGEGNVRNSTSIGGGIYKSIDGGRSWRLMGLERTERINRIALHPSDSRIAYVAAMGELWGENSERGIYKTTDGGETWSKILYVDEKTGATDIKMDPENPEKLYAGMWQFRRWPYHFKSGGPGSGVYLSYDGGETWQRKTEEDGLPEGELGRTVFAPSRAEPRLVYLLVEAEKSALLRSRDGGESWSKVNEAYDIADRPMYYSELAADPNDANRVYNIATRLRVSIDGGKSFEANPGVDCCRASNTIHIDNHAFWIHPEDSRHLILGNDGGIAISRDQGETWRFVRNLPLAQFYHVAVDDDQPYNVYGGLQDNGSWRGPAEVWENGGIRNLHWQEVGFGDGFDTIPDPESSRMGYAMSQGGRLYTWNLDTGERRTIRPAPPSTEVELRFNWNAGFAVDPFDPATIYYGSQFVHLSLDRGLSWTTISDDLTSNDASLQTFKESGGLTPDVTAAENYTSIVSIAPSRIAPGVLWVGTDDGRVHVTQDQGGSWSRIDDRGRQVPEGAWVPMIHPSPHDAGMAHLVFDDHRRSDMRPHVYRVEDFGARWQRLEVPASAGYALSILQDPVDAKLLFLGAELGLYVSTDSGANWTKFQAGVPTVSVMDMAFQHREKDLVLGTHGRSIYVIDDYSALRNLAPSDFEEPLKILSTSLGQQYRPNQTPSTRFPGSGEFRAKNEPYGVMVTFMASGDDLPHPDDEKDRERRIRRRGASELEDKTSEGEEGEAKNGKESKIKVSVTIRDSEGELIRTFKRPAHQGINRVVWDIKRDGVRPMPSPKKKDPEEDLPAGPEVLPGTYTLALELRDLSVQSDVQVVVDPRSTFSLEQRQENDRVQLELLELRETGVTAVERIVQARQDIQSVKTLIERQDAEDYKELSDKAKKLEGSLDDLEKLFRALPETKGITYGQHRAMSRLRTATSYVASSADAPSQTANFYVEDAKAAMASAIQTLNDFLETDLVELRDEVQAAGLELLADRGLLSLP